jgi:hypothetical protein
MLPELPHAHLGTRVVVPIDALREWLRARVTSEGERSSKIAEDILRDFDAVRSNAGGGDAGRGSNAKAGFDYWLMSARFAPRMSGDSLSGTQPAGPGNAPGGTPKGWLHAIDLLTRLVAIDGGQGTSPVSRTGEPPGTHSARGRSLPRADAQPVARMLGVSVRTVGRRVAASRPMSSKRSRWERPS